MLRRLETMVLMTGYELPLRAIREQIASAVDLIVHTARLKDGSRKIVNITEVYGIDDDEILTQDIFAFEQTGVRDGKIEGTAQADRHPADVHGRFKASGIDAAARRVRHPARGPGAPDASPARARAAGGPATRSCRSMPSRASVGLGRAVTAGGMVYVSSIGPVDPDDRPGRPAATIKEQTRQCLANLQGQARGGRQLARQGRLGELVAARPDRVRPVQRGMGALVPGRRADRPGDADAAAPAARRVPRLDRGHRRGLTAWRPARERRSPSCESVTSALIGQRVAVAGSRPDGAIVAAASPTRFARRHIDTASAMSAIRKRTNPA